MQMRIPTNEDVIRTTKRVIEFLGVYGFVVAAVIIMTWWGYGKVEAALNSGPAPMYQFGHVRKGDTVEYSGKDYIVGDVLDWNFSPNRVEIYLNEVK